ncbi:hypothetical protein G6F47_013127 [Rhizopus delemar]|nr:hypothetical protein G6F54_013477 [Rhizopus delemar]KAG1488790.1 hypothetical protein G6F53_013525 [Rhizopus delemar]KAG1577354.1 hypothetical protein G6F47_013127 [Rhizopus delemar]
MSQHFTLANLQMSPNAIANVDMSNPNDISNVFKYLLNTVNTLQERVTTHDDILNELSTLRTENATLKAEIANLHAQLKSASNKLSTATDSNVVSSSVPLDRPPNQVSTVSVPTYSAVAARAGPKPVTKKRKLAAGRAFQPIDPSAPRGFEYLYLNRTRKLSRAEIRRNLRLIGFDLSRVLDICFPGPKVIGSVG